MSEITDLYITLAAVNAPMLAAFTEATAAGEAMTAALTASLAEVSTAMAGVATGAGESAGIAALGTEAEVAAGKVAAAGTEVDAAFTEIGITAKSSAAEVQASFAVMGASLDATAAKMGSLSGENAAMLAKMKADNEALAAAASEAELGTAAVGDAMAGTTATSAAANTTLGMSNNTLLAVGAAAVGVAYEATKMAGDFQSAITRLNTSAGESKNNLQMVNDGILAMAGSVGYSADQLATAMYKVESGGQHGAAGLKVLQAAAEGAKTENADLTTVADALTSAMTDYKIPADQAAATTSKLVAATSQGKMTFEELAGSLASVLPVASANHVSLNDILGDLASMTTHGMSAQQATQNLSDTIRHMAAPTQAQAKELAALGLNATEVSKQLGEQGLSGTINMISQRIQSQMGPDGMVVVNLTNALKGLPAPVQELGQKVLDGSMSMKDFTASAKAMNVINDKNVTSFASLAGSMHGIGTEAKSGAEVYQTYSGALRQAMGDATGMNVALMIGGENAGITANAIQAVSSASAEAGNHVAGWSEIQGNFNQKIAQAKDAFGALMISIGEKLLPVLTVVAGAFATTATFMAQHQTVAVALAAVVGGALVLAFVALTYAVAKWVATSVAGLASDTAAGAKWVVAKLAQLLGVTTATEAEAAAEVTAETTGGVRRVAAAVVSGARWLAVKTTQGAAAVASAVAQGAAVTAAWVAAEASQLAGAVASGAVWLATKTAQGAAAVASAIASSAAAVAAWVAGNAAMLASQLADGAVWLATWIAQGVAAAASSVAEAAVAVAAWAAANAGIILATGGVVLAIGAVLAIGYLLITHWNDVKRISGEVWNAVTSAVSSMASAVGGLISGLIGMFSDFGSLLVGAGTALVQGLWSGISSGWSWLTGQVSSLASSLKNAALSALGISSPSKVFADEVGAWIAPGIAQGITATTHIATRAATDLARSVTQAAHAGSDGGSFQVGSSGVIGDSVAPAFVPSVTATSGGGQVVHLNVNVAGHVWTTADLVQEIQQQLLRHQIRNPTNGTNYSFA